MIQKQINIVINEPDTTQLHLYKMVGFEQKL